MVSFLFSQAEVGIRDYRVTGVQTCALPILLLDDTEIYPASNAYGLTNVPTMFWISEDGDIEISSVGWSRQDFEEVVKKDRKSGRVGKECRSRWSPYH